MIREKVMNHSLLLEVGVAKYLKEAMMFSKFRCEPHVPLRTPLATP